jgi:DNA-binding NarL/FixJ family response regulator
MRVIIAEDSVIFRDGLIRLLEDRGHEVVAAVGDGDALVSAAAEHQPDVAVVDIRMPPGHTDEGLRAAIAVREAQPNIGVLVFSQYVETRYAARLLAENSAGVGYLLKDRVAETSEFVDALSRVAAGGTALDPEVVSQLVATSHRGQALDRTLTAREHEVLELMAEGRSNAAIAGRLVVREGAVEKHVANIFAKLGLPVSHEDNRRVLAVLRYLRSTE